MKTIFNKFQTFLLLAMLAIVWSCDRQNKDGGLITNVSFAKLQKANQISFYRTASGSGRSGLILAQDQEGNNGFKISFEPSANRLASYVMSNGSEDFANAYPLTGIAGTNYDVTIQMSNDVCVVYVNDKIAFSNRVYDIVNRKWSIFGTSGGTFSNIKIKNP